MQPTDFRVWSVFVFLGHGGRKEERAWHRTKVYQGLVVQDAEDRPMKDRLMRVLTALSAVAAMALAGRGIAEGLLEQEFALSTQVLFPRMGRTG